MGLGRLGLRESGALGSKSLGESIAARFSGPGELARESRGPEAAFELTSPEPESPRSVESFEASPLVSELSLGSPASQATSVEGWV